MTDDLSVGAFVLTEHLPEASPATCRDEIRAQAELVESLGYDSLWIGEHHFTDRIYFDNFQILSYLAGVTDSLTLGTSISLAPLHNPVMLAERTANVDVLSDGRFVFGVAAGYREEEFEIAGVDHATRGDRLDETLDLLELLWAEDGISYSGDVFDLDDVSINPKPLQDGGPPVWIGGTGPRPVERAADRGDAWLADPRISVPKLEKPASFYEDQLADRDRTPSARPIWREVFVGETTEDAVETARPYLMDKYDAYHDWGADDGVGEDSVDAQFDDLASDRFLLGSPDAVREEIETYRETFGMDHLIIRCRWPGMPAETARASFRRFAEDVMPHFR